MILTSALPALLLGWFLAFPAQAVNDDELLPPDQAFKASAHMLDAETLEVEWDIADGYYLYGAKLKVRSDTDGVQLGTPDLPPGKVKHDEFFGDVEIHRHRLRFQVPVERPGVSGPAEFRLLAQGCADAGVCYPPQSHPVRLDLPAEAPRGEAAAAPAPAKLVPASAPGATAVLADLLDPRAAPVSGADGSSPETSPGALAALAGLGDRLGLAAQDDEFLPPDQAFQFTARVDDPNTIVAGWIIADGYYLYQQRFKFRLQDASGVTLGAPRFPPGEEKQDEHFGLVTTYHHGVEIPIPVERSDHQALEVILEVGYQGCAEAGLCYPPQRRSIPLLLPALDANAKPTDAVVATAAAIDAEGERGGESITPAVAPRAEPAPTTTDEEPVSESDQLARVLAGGNIAASLALFFVGGLLLAFTPCVFPMIPILSSIIVGQGQDMTTYRAFILSSVYVLAMAVTYTVVGVIAGVAGENLQAMFQNPWVLSSFALVFVLLAISMFGFYELQLPSSWQSKLTELSNRQHGGTLLGVAIMGLLSALIVGPCVAPPLMAALIYIGQSGDPYLGGAALFALSLGMGLPLVIIGTLGGRWLPRAGAWMDAVKIVFGVLLLGVAIWMLERILPGPLALLLWSALFLASAVYLGALEPLTQQASGWKRLWKALGVLLGLYGALLMIGAASGGNDLLRPLRGLVGHTAGGAATEASTPAGHLAFRRVDGLEGLQQALRESRGKPVMLDFYADWCVSCKEMENYTFTDPGVQAVLGRGVSLQADVTENNERDQALLRHFGLIGPPAILFFDPDGTELRGWRFVGYKDAEAFREHAGKAFGLAP